MKSLTNTLFLIAIACFASQANAEEWGTVKGQFVYGGKKFKGPEKIAPKSAFCAKQKLVVEDLVVDDKSKGIANAIVYLYQKRGAKPPKIHPAYAKSAKEKVVLVNEKCRFVPRISLVRTGQTLEIQNADPEAHNAAIVTLKNQPKNAVIPAGKSSPRTFENAESLPSLLRCDVHPFMSGRVLIKDHPYMAVSDKDGKFEIKNMPVGKHVLQLWHEKSGYIATATVGGKKVKIKRGRLELTVKPGDNDIGVYTLGDALLFKK